MLSTLLLLSLVTTTDTTTYSVDNHGRKAGELVVVTTKDSVIARWIYTDRNRGQRIETRYRMGTDGRAVSGEQRPVLPDGTAGAPSESFRVDADSVRWTLGTNVPSAAKRDPAAWVGVRGGTPLEQTWITRFLLASPKHAATFGPFSLTAEVLADTTFTLAGRRQRARLVAVFRGEAPVPTLTWLDADGALLATEAAWFITHRQDVAPLLPAFRAVEFRWRDARGDEMQKRVLTPTKGTIAIRGGDLFDSETGTVRPDQTVLVRGDRIVAVGASNAIAIPADATVIDATGKTIMPGMWDMHGHMMPASQSQAGPQQLAFGITTVRDLASDLDFAVSYRDRERAGKLAMPRLVLGGFIEGPLAWAGPSEAIARDEAEARAWVQRYAKLGYKQIKLYNVLHPDLVPTIAAETKKHGMLLSGHIPRGMSIAAAVNLGFDEIQHAAFLISDSYPDSLYLPRMRAYSQVATAVAPNFDVNAPGVTKLLDLLKAKGTVIDGTFGLWIGGGGAAVGAGGSNDQQRADSAYLGLIRRLHQHGIQLVAGTDNPAGFGYRRELEMYALAGVPLPKVLQIATIDAARFMKDDKDYGSVSVGKVADIIVVNGKPAEKLSDLANVETVLRGGRLYKVSELTKALASRTATAGR